MTTHLRLSAGDDTTVCGRRRRDSEDLPYLLAEYGERVPVEERCVPCWDPPGQMALL